MEIANSKICKFSLKTALQRGHCGKRKNNQNFQETWMFYFNWPIPDGSEEDMSVGVGFWRNTSNKRVVIFIILL